MKNVKGSTRSCENKQISFNCGTASHIARNCSNRMFVHFSTPRKENVSRGRSLTRKSSRSRLREDGWKILNNKKKAYPKPNKQVFYKSTITEPMSILSKGAFGSSTTRSRKSKRSKKKKNVPNPPVNFLKPNYKWVPKSTIVRSSSSSECVFDVNLINSKDKFVNVKGRPMIVMTWVPKTK